MPLGGAENPFGGLNLTPRTARALPAADPDLADGFAAENAALQARKQAEVAHIRAEEQEETRAEIYLAVQTSWNYCGLEPCEANADLATDILAQHQAIIQQQDPTYVLGEAETQADLNTIVERGKQRLERRNARAASNSAAAFEGAEELEQRLTRVSHTVAHEQEKQVRNLHTVAAETDLREGLDNRAEWMAQFDGDFIAMIEAAGEFPTEGNPVLEAEQAKLVQFQRILLAASSVPADANIIRNRLRSLDFSDGVPDPIQFARAFIFDNPNSQLHTGVSEATQAAIADTLGIQRPDLDVTTGSEMTDVFEKGIGTHTVRDPETGELREEPLHLEPGEFHEIRNGQFIGLTEHGERAMKFSGEVGDFMILLPNNATAEDMTMYGLAGQMMSQLHEVNMAEMMYPGRDMMERGGGQLDIRLPGDFNRTQRLCQIFFGGLAGHNGELLHQSDLDRIPYLMQFQNAKGDAVIGDVNPEQMRAEYRRQGIVDADGNFDWDLFATMVEANRLGLWTSEESFGRSATP